jgi:large subunit ribosomal protein L49
MPLLTFIDTILKYLPAASDESSNSSTSTESKPIGDKLPYHVTRTHTNNLPVYVDVRSGGTRIETMIRRVHGDSNRLLKDVSQALGLDDVKAYVKQPTGHVIFKGRHKDQIMDFLVKQGF